LLETAWTRAVLAEEFPMAREAARQRAMHQPPIPPLMAHSMALADTDHAGWRQVLLQRMVKPSEFLQGPAWRAEAPWFAPTPLTLPPGPIPMTPFDGDVSDSRARWCNATSGTPAHNKQPDALHALAFLPLVEQRRHAVDIDRLGRVLPDSIYFTKAAIATMKETPQDPVVPDALSVAVRMARFTCHTDKTAGQWSRKGYEALEKNYPGSPWAEATPFWYNPQ